MENETLWDLIRTNGGFFSRADLARLMLEPLPLGPARSALEELCDTVVTRSN